MSGRRAVDFFAALLALALLAPADGHAQTKVARSAECEVMIVIPLEVFGPRATKALADRWKKNIEATWNGPTSEMIEQIATQTPGLLQQDMPKFSKVDVTDGKGNVVGKEDEIFSKIEREQLRKAYEDFMRSIGGDTHCATANCCTEYARPMIRRLQVTIKSNLSRQRMKRASPSDHM
jgi:hypothetical protein